MFSSRAYAFASVAVFPTAYTLLWLCIPVSASDGRPNFWLYAGINQMIGYYMMAQLATACLFETFRPGLPVLYFLATVGMSVAVGVVLIVIVGVSSPDPFAQSEGLFYAMGVVFTLLTIASYVILGMRDRRRREIRRARDAPAPSFSSSPAAKAPDGQQQDPEDAASPCRTLSICLEHVSLLLFGKYVPHASRFPEDDSADPATLDRHHSLSVGLLQQQQQQQQDQDQGQRQQLSPEEEKNVGATKPLRPEISAFLLMATIISVWIYLQYFCRWFTQASESTRQWMAVAFEVSRIVFLVIARRCSSSGGRGQFFGDFAVNIMFYCFYRVLFTKNENWQVFAVIVVVSLSFEIVGFPLRLVPAVHRMEGRLLVGLGLQRSLRSYEKHRERVLRAYFWRNAGELYSLSAIALLSSLLALGVFNNSRFLPFFSQVSSAQLVFTLWQFGMLFVIEVVLLVIVWFVIWKFCRIDYVGTTLRESLDWPFARVLVAFFGAHFVQDTFNPFLQVQ